MQHFRIILLASFESLKFGGVALLVMSLSLIGMHLTIEKFEVSKDGTPWAGLIIVFTIVTSSAIISWFIGEILFYRKTGTIVKVWW